MNMNFMVSLTFLCLNGIMASPGLSVVDVSTDSIQTPVSKIRKDRGTVIVNLEDLEHLPKSDSPSHAYGILQGPEFDTMKLIPSSKPRVDMVIPSSAPIRHRDSMHKKHASIVLPPISEGQVLQMTNGDDSLHIREEDDDERTASQTNHRKMISSDSFRSYDTERDLNIKRKDPVYISGVQESDRLKKISNCKAKEMVWIEKSSECVCAINFKWSVTKEKCINKAGICERPGEYWSSWQGDCIKGCRWGYEKNRFGICNYNQCKATQAKFFTFGTLKGKCECKNPHQSEDADNIEGFDTCKFCRGGFQMVNRKCEICPSGTFREPKTELLCTKCPLNHVSGPFGAKTCMKCGTVDPLDPYQLGRGTAPTSVNATHCHCTDPHHVYLPRYGHCVKPCGPGKGAFWEQGTFEQACLDCPVGKPNPNNAGNCEFCPTGTFVAKKWNNVEFCQSCPLSISKLNVDSKPIKTGLSKAHNSCQCTKSDELYYAPNNKCYPKCTEGTERVTLSFPSYFSSHTTFTEPTCHICDKNHYNDVRGGDCKPCGRNTDGTDDEHTRCTCLVGFFHPHDDLGSCVQRLDE